MSAICEMVRAAEQARVQALRAGDVVALEELLHPDLVFGHASGAQDDRAEFLARLSDGRLRYVGIRSAETRIRQIGAHVLLWSEIESEIVTLAGPKALRNATLTTWDCSDGHARLLAHHSTVLPPTS